MKLNKQLTLINTRHIFVMSVLAIGTIGCGSGDDSSSKTGYVKFYNASSNAPDVYLTIDENLDTSEDDEVEITFSGISYGQALSNNELVSQDYFLNWLGKTKIAPPEVSWNCCIKVS